MSKPRKGGINPWVPNQHGAWAMLILPIAAGMFTGLVPSGSYRSAEVWLTFLGICVAWMTGYFCFFAFGLWFKARSAARKKQYFTPMVTYGSTSAAGAVLALCLHPELIFWAIPFSVLVAIALWEIYLKRPRSLASGISTTVASALMYPVMVGVGCSHPDAASPCAISTTVVIALYFVGTIFYVKSIIREKGNQSFYRVSVVYHAIACAVAVVATVPLMLLGMQIVPSIAGLIVLFASLARAITVPPKAQENPQQWTPKKAGLREIPLTLLLGIGSCFTFIL